MASSELRDASGCVCVCVCVCDLESIVTANGCRGNYPLTVMQTLNVCASSESREV